MYQIPPSSTHQGHRADSWNVDKWLRAVKVKVTSRGQKGTIKLEDKDSGELFAECPLPNDAPVATAVEPVIDSSRYFVLRVVDETTGRHAFLGLGFRERDHASDFKLAVQEHQNVRQREQEAMRRTEEHTRLLAEKAAANAALGLLAGDEPTDLNDYSLKGTVTVNIPRRMAQGAARSGSGSERATGAGTMSGESGTSGFGAFGLAPPPTTTTSAATAVSAVGGVGIAPPPSAMPGSSPPSVSTDGGGSTIMRSPTAGTGLNSGGWTVPVVNPPVNTPVNVPASTPSQGEGWANFDEPAKGDEDWADFQS